ncbi:MAG: porin [Caulobacteraceae bacterium]
MPKYSRELRAVLAAGAALAVIVAADAQAKPVKHRHSAGPTKSELELKAQVDALRTQVQSLEGRLDAQARTQQQTQAQTQAQTQTQIQAAQNQAQAAQAQAQTAQTQLQTAQAQIQTLPDEVKTQVAAATPKPGWWGQTTLGGRIYSDVSSIQNFSNGVRQADSGVDYDIKRFYVIIDHKFNDMWSANMTTDFIYDSTSKATQLFIKKAYLQAKLSDALNFRAGASDLPWIPFVESLNGYRYVEKMMLDRDNFGATTDWGLHMFGSLANNIVSYQVSVFDGSGFKIPAIGTANRTDSVDVEGRLAATYHHFTAAVGGYDGKLGKDVVNPNPPFTPTTFHTARRFDALLAYTDSRIRVGGEYFWTHDWNDVAQANPNLVNNARGFSGFGSFNFTPKLAVFGRYDYVQPFYRTTPGAKENYFNVGISYKPIKPLDFALVYKRDALGDVPAANSGISGITPIGSTLNDAGFNTGNGVIGGTVRGTYDEIGIFSQVNF